ncbi:MAG: GspH/FimT family pseudopilin [Acidobacteriota bacterium]
MGQTLRRNAGFTLMDLTITVAVFATASAVAIPMVGQAIDNMRVRMAARDVERELQAARLKAVSSNRPMRVRFNCPSAGQYRTVELIGTPSVPDTLDNDVLRCGENAFPYPARDDDPLTRPNLDGPLRRLPVGVSFSSVQTIEFWPNGTARISSGGTTPWPKIQVQGLALSVVKGSTTRSMMVTGLGRIKLQ